MLYSDDIYVIIYSCEKNNKEPQCAQKDKKSQKEELNLNCINNMAEVKNNVH